MLLLIIIIIFGHGLILSFLACRLYIGSRLLNSLLLCLNKHNLQLFLFLLLLLNLFGFRWTGQLAARLGLVVHSLRSGLVVIEEHEVVLVEDVIEVSDVDFLATRDLGQGKGLKHLVIKARCNALISLLRINIFIQIFNEQTQLIPVRFLSSSRLSTAFVSFNLGRRSDRLCDASFGGILSIFKCFIDYLRILDQISLVRNHLISELLVVLEHGHLGVDRVQFDADFGQHAHHRLLEPCC